MQTIPIEQVMYDAYIIQSIERCFLPTEQEIGMTIGFYIDCSKIQKPNFIEPSALKYHNSPAQIWAKNGDSELYCLEGHSFSSGEEVIIDYYNPVTRVWNIHVVDFSGDKYPYQFLADNVVLSIP